LGLEETSCVDGEAIAIKVVLISVRGTNRREVGECMILPLVLSRDQVQAV